MSYRYFWGNPLEYLEELIVAHHPCNARRPWFLDSKDSDLRLNFNDTVCKVLKLSRQDYEEAMKLFNGRLNGTSVFFRDYDDAESAKEWIASMITMSKLQERTPSI